MRRTSVFSVGLVLVASVAWFAIANHCALASLGAPAREVAARYHADCCRDQSPEKEKNKNPTECCKTLHATLNVPAKKLAGYHTSVFAWQLYFIGPVIMANESNGSLHGREFDTGPPFAETFAESILQRSILAHAPPSLT